MPSSKSFLRKEGVAGHLQGRHFFKSTLFLPTFIILAGLALRFVLVLTHDNYLGVDGGAYLNSALDVLGRGSYSPDFTRPPLSPGWLLVPFVEVWGQDIGYKIWQAVASLAPLPAVYLLTRQFTNSGVALIAAAFVAVNLLHAEMLVTGALPLIGYGLIGVGLWAMGRIMHGESRNIHAVALMAVIPALAYINMTTAGIALLAFPLFFGALLYFHRTDDRVILRQKATVVLFAWLIGAVLAATALPWYMDVLPGRGNLDYPGPAFYLTPFGNWGWLMLVWGLLLGAGVLWKASDARLKALGILCIMFGLLSVVWSYDETIMNVTFRGRYLLIMLAHPIGAWAVFKWGKGIRLRTAGWSVFTGLTVSTFLFIYAFHAQAYYSDQITTDTIPALAYLRENAPESPVIVNTFSMAWWVQAVNGVKVYNAWNTKPPERWREDDELVRRWLGWDVVRQPRHDADELALQDAQSLGVGYILVDTSYPDRNATSLYGAPDDPWLVTAKAPWLELVYEKGHTKLWKIQNTP